VDGAEVVAVDLGGASGRVMLGRIGPGELALREVHRFPNRSVQLGRTLYWNAPALFRGILDGLREAGSWTGGRPHSVGVAALVIRRVRSPRTSSPRPA
jgi:rhamnulokinase